MLRHSLRMLGLCGKRTIFMPQVKNYGGIVNRSMASFCQTKKDTHQSHAKEDQTAKGSQQNGQKVEKNEAHDHGDKHQHSQHCRHHEHHQHHKPHDHHAHLQKLNKMSFEELIELKTEESLKLANHRYEHEARKLKEVKAQQEKMKESLKFYDQIDEEIREKEKKLAENLKIYEEEVGLTKKRAEKQINESKDYAVTKIAKELLEVADCIASCKKYADQSEVKDKYIENVVKTEQLLKAILKKYEIEEFDPTNQDYDPNLHEGLLQIPTPPGYETNKVAMVMRTGYTIKGRLLRSARVGIFS